MTQSSAGEALEQHQSVFMELSTYRCTMVQEAHCPAPVLLGLLAGAGARSGWGRSAGEPVKLMLPSGCALLLSRELPAPLLPEGPRSGSSESLPGQAVRGTRSTWIAGCSRNRESYATPPEKGTAGLSGQPLLALLLLLLNPVVLCLHTLFWPGGQLELGRGLGLWVPPAR